MILKDELQPIRNWAKEKGIFDKGDSKTQYLKLQEEAGELAKAILTNDEPEIIDALGDCTVVLVNLAKLCGYNLEDCINSAYDVISKRTGKMENGTFVKNQKPVVKLEKHRNGYFNFPCKFTDIIKYMDKNDVLIDGKKYTSLDNLHVKAKPSRNGGVAYVYPNNL